MLINKQPNEKNVTNRVTTDQDENLEKDYFGKNYEVYLTNHPKKKEILRNPADTRNNKTNKVSSPNKKQEKKINQDNLSQLKEKSHSSIDISRNEGKTEEPFTASMSKIESESREESIA